MNNLKLGLSALAGSLVAVSASASEVTVTGDTIITWKSAEGNENGAAAVTVKVLVLTLTFILMLQEN